MNIRGIIEKWHSIFSNYAQHGYTAAVHARDFEEIRDDLAIALEEIALMEAVCEAAVDNSVCVCGKVWRYENHLHAESCPVQALIAYRKERGL